MRSNYDARRSRSSAMSTRQKSDRQKVMRSRRAAFAAPTRGIKSGTHGFVSPKKLVGNIQALSTAIVKGAITFSLVDLSDYLSWANIYDQYRITKVKVFIIGETQPGLPATGPGYADLISVIDYDSADTTSFTTAAELLNYQTSMIHPPGQVTSRSFYPRCTMGVWNTNVVSAAAVGNKAQWIDCSYPNVVHYGFKFCTTQATSTAVPAWNIYVQPFFQFRNNR